MSTQTLEQLWQHYARQYAGRADAALLAQLQMAFFSGALAAAIRAGDRLAADVDDLKLGLGLLEQDAAIRRTRGGGS